MQFKRTMCLATMQKDRDAGDRNMRNHHRKNEHLPSCGTGKSIAQEIHGTINKITQNI